jgi:hypothetical protein
MVHQTSETDYKGQTVHRNRQSGSCVSVRRPQNWQQTAAGRVDILGNMVGGTRQTFATKKGVLYQQSKATPIKISTSGHHYMEGDRRIRQAACMGDRVFL